MHEYDVFDKLQHKRISIGDVIKVGVCREGDKIDGDEGTVVIEAVDNFGHREFTSYICYDGYFGSMNMLHSIRLLDELKGIDFAFRGWKTFRWEL